MDQVGWDLKDQLILTPTGRDTIPLEQVAQREFFNSTLSHFQKLIEILLLAEKLTGPTAAETCCGSKPRHPAEIQYCQRAHSSAEC